MSRLDMSDVLSDPDFTDKISVTRTLVTVDNNGVRQISREFIGGVTAIITMNDNLDLLRLPESERLQGSITIHTIFRLTDGKSDQGADADLVQYQGRTYTVTSVGDWSRYGAGFVSAIATLTQVNP